MRMRSIKQLLTRSRLLAVSAVLGWGGLAGCGSIEPVAPFDPITDPTQLYMSLTLDHPAVTMSTDPAYNTVQLTATPRDAHGNPMAGLPAPTFKVLDTTKVEVTAGGLVTAVGTTGGGSASVIASLTVGPVTHADTAEIRITNLTNPPQLDTLSIDPLPPDSAVWGIQSASSVYESGLASVLREFVEFFGPASPELIGLVQIPRVVPRAVNTTGGAISGLLVEYQSLNPAIALVGRRDGLATPRLPGQVAVVARTMAYGVARADTVTYTVTFPPFRALLAGTSEPHVEWHRAKVPPSTPGLGWGLVGENQSAVIPDYEFRVAPSGIVFWLSSIDDSVEVVFDDPTNVVSPPVAICNDLQSVAGFFVDPDICGAGNVIIGGRSEYDAVAFDPELAVYFTIRLRQFPVPGVYPFRTTRPGGVGGGRVVVTSELE